jgi:archaellum component FlaC
LDIERLKRLNALAGELKGHHIAENYEDAACLAVSMVSQEPETCFTGMHLSDDQSVLVQEIIKEYPQETQKSLNDVQESVQESRPAQQSLSREEIEKVLQYFADQFTNEINSLQQKVQHAEAMVAEVSAELRAVKDHVQREQVQSHEPVQSVQKEVMSQVPKAEPLPEKQQYMPEDVSVEKMFYFGKK